MKIVFLQNKGGNYGGVWQVNKTVGEALINIGYEVSIVSIRDDHFGITLEHDPRLEVVTINEKDIWHTYYGSDFKESLSGFHLIRLIKQILHRLRNIKRLKKDKKKLTEYLDNYKPDYIVVTQYQVLDLIDPKYLGITYHEQHAGFRDTISNKATMDTFYRYNDKIKGFIWLTKKTMEKAIEAGLHNNTYIYNPVRLETNKTNDLNNNRLVTIARLSSEKRIDLMIKMVEEIFNDEKYNNWSLEVYGDGEEEEYLKSLIHTSQIKLMGPTSNIEDVLLSSSINLNTSENEGFPMTILEAYACGVPTVSLVFGESIYESIIDNKTGFVCNNEEEFKDKLKELMDNKELLIEFSNNGKEYCKNFKKDKIVNDWDNLFNNVK